MDLRAAIFIGLLLIQVLVSQKLLKKKTENIKVLFFISFQNMLLFFYNFDHTMIKYAQTLVSSYFCCSSDSSRCTLTEGCSEGFFFNSVCVA